MKYETPYTMMTKSYPGQWPLDFKSCCLIEMAMLPFPGFMNGCWEEWSRHWSVGGALSPRGQHLTWLFTRSPWPKPSVIVCIRQWIKVVSRNMQTIIQTLVLFTMAYLSLAVQSKMLRGRNRIRCWVRGSYSTGECCNCNNICKIILSIHRYEYRAYSVVEVVSYLSPAQRLVFMTI